MTRSRRLGSIAVYIASPYTVGDAAENVRRSLEAADQLLALGYLPFAPLLSHFWHFLSPKPYDAWMEIDQAWILRCDCVLRLPGESKGADAEVTFAQKHGKLIVRSVEELHAVYGFPTSESHTVHRSDVCPCEICVAARKETGREL